MLDNYTHSTWSNGTYIPFDEERHDRTPIETFQRAEKVLFIVIAISTVVGNTLVLLATWKEKKLHQPNKYFIACLAVADLLVGMFVAPSKLYILYLDSEARRSISIHLCRFIAWVDTLAFCGSIYTLAFISYDRYLKISKPLQYRSKMTTSKSLKIIFTIWLISNALAAYAVSPSGIPGILKNRRHSCSAKGVSDNGKKFCLFIMMYAFLLPFFFIFIMYTLIFVLAHKRQKRLRNGALGESRNDRSQQSIFRQDLKVIRMLLVFVGMFIVCWSPFVIYNFLLLYYPNVIDRENLSSRGRYSVRISIEAVEFLPLFNSACNPIIYASLDQTYREAFKNLFQRLVLCRRN